MCTYFSRPGKENTVKTLKVAREYAEKFGIRNIVVASTTGETGLLATEVFKGFNLVIVTHATGFVKPGFQEMKDDIRRELERRGAKVLTCVHAFAGIERGIRLSLNTWLPVDLIALTLRKLFGEGVKVAIEITLMAADAGLIPLNEDVIAIAGTSHGADTALHIKPSTTSYFFDLKVRRIICKPDTF